MRDLRWFEEYAENHDMLEPLTDAEWQELASLLHDANSHPAPTEGTDSE